MSRSSVFAGIVGWLMLLAGGTALFACVFLPPWLEIRELRAERDAAREQVARLEEQLTRVTKQSEHFRSDPAYLERLARKEFGTVAPGVEIIPVEPELEQLPPASASDGTASDDELAAALEESTRTNPLVAVFVLDTTRPIVMAMSGVVVVMALVVLVRGPTRKD